MTTPVLQKFEALLALVRSYKRVGVAFSGGIDSSLLLYAAGRALGKKNVLALHGRSLLNCDSSDIEGIFAQHFQGYSRLKIVDLSPLDWPDFVNNDSARCYHCKKKTYALFKQHLKEENISVLLDGTNVDDRQEHRPGYAVLEELQVYAPMEEVGITKKEIRFLAKFHGLSHFNLPSNSCLATRLGYLPRIGTEEVARVKRIESALGEMGFEGCRARPHDIGVFLEVRQQDFVKISSIHYRMRIARLCRDEGFADVFLRLRGR